MSGTSTDDTESTISLPGGGPECLGCGGPTYLVTENPEEGTRPWWCPHCNVRLDEDGGYGAQASFPSGSEPTDTERPGDAE
jgi:hypothetical protein